MTKIETIIQMNKNILCSSIIGNTIYNGKQIREWCGEKNQKKKHLTINLKFFYQIIYLV